MNRIKELRKSNKMTQFQLAEVLFVDQTAVSKWEKGIAYPSAETQERLADYFNCSVDYLLGRAEETLENIYSGHEKKLIDEYRNRPEMQKAVDTLLGL